MTIAESLIKILGFVNSRMHVSRHDRMARCCGEMTRFDFGKLSRAESRQIIIFARTVCELNFRFADQKERKREEPVVILTTNYVIDDYAGYPGRCSERTDKRNDK